MRTFFDFFDRWLMRLMSVVIFVSTAAIICLISFLILSRFVFGWSIVGLLELSTLSALWLYMVGAIVASRNREHITVDFITQSLNSPRLRAAHEVAVSVIIFVFGLFFLSLTKDMIDWSLHRPQVTPGLGISLFYGQAALVAAAVVGTAYTLRDIIKSAGVLVHGNRGA